MVSWDMRKTPMQMIHYFALPLTKIPPSWKQDICSVEIEFTDFFRRFRFQIISRECNKFFTYRLYLEMIARNWINPTDEQMREDLWIIISL